MATPFTDHTKLGIVGNLNPSSSNTPKIGIVGKLQENIYNPKRSNVDYIGYDTSINVDRYKRFIDEIYPGVNLEKQAAQNQSPWGKIGNMFVQGVVGEILAQGVIGGAGSILSIPETITDSFHRDTADFGNFMTRFADTITNTLSESAPIFRYNEGKTFDWKDLGWWTSQGVSLFSAIGLLIPALGEAKAASYFSKALYKVAAISRLNKLNKTSKTFVAASDIFDTERYWQKITHSAIAMRNAENVRESSQAYTTIYNETLDTIQDDTKFQELINSPIGQEFLSRGNGTDKNEFAKYIASKAAWKNYTMNAANVFFDAMQLAPLFKGFKIKTNISPLLTSKGVKAAQKNALEGVSDVSTKAILPGFNAYPLIKGSSLLVGEQLSEGAEELVNAVAQSESNWYGKHLVNQEKDSTFNTRLGEYLRDPSSWEQAFWGFAGGVAFSGTTRGIAKIQNVLNDVIDPHSSEARISEIQNRYTTLASFSAAINDTLKGLDINTPGKKLEGTEEQIEKIKESRIEHIKTLMGYRLGFDAAKAGNVQLLLDMIEHPDFKQKMIDFGLGTEESFDKDLADIKHNILSAEQTYKDTYAKIFTGTHDKPWLRDLIISESVDKKAEIRQSTKLRDAARVKASNLKANSPAYEALREQNKDKDFTGTLDALINAEVINNINAIVASEKNPNTKSVYEAKATELKNDVRLKDKELGDNKASGDFSVISDIIEAEKDAKLYDLFVHANNSEYEEIINTNKHIPVIENKLKLATEKAYAEQFDTFKKKINEASRIDIFKDTNETINSKIATIDSIIEKLNKDKLDPFVIDKSPTQTLRKQDIEKYLSVLNNTREILENQKAKISDKNAILAERKRKNEEVIQNTREILRQIGITDVNVNFISNQRNEPLAKEISKQMIDLEIHPDTPSPHKYGRLLQLINKEITLEEFGNTTALREALKKDFTSFGKFLPSLINEILVKAGYIVDYNDITPPTGGDNPTLTHLKNFEDSLGTEEDTKNVINFNVENPIGKIDFANKLITHIINSGEKPLFTDTNLDGTPKTGRTLISFEKIAARFGQLIGTEIFEAKYEVLKEAYRLIRSNKNNPYASGNYNFNSDEVIDKLNIKDIIANYGIKNETKTYEFGDLNALKNTGGLSALNTFVFEDIDKPLKTDENGNKIASDDIVTRLEELLNGLEEGTQVIIKHNTDLKGDKGFSKNKDNPDTIPIGVYVVKDNVPVLLTALNTSEVTHSGVKYNFNGKDWTDTVINDINTSNTKIDSINRLFPLLQNFLNAIKINNSSTTRNYEASKAFTELIEADTFGVLNELIGSDIDIRSTAGLDAVYHVTKCMFFGMNTEGDTPLELKRTKILANVIHWKDKLYRDYLNNAKIRNILGTDVDKVIDSKISYITTGTFVKRKNGFNNLNVIDNPKNVKLFTIQKGSGNKVLENTKNGKEILTKSGATGSYSNSLFVGVVGRGGKHIIPSPVSNNTINGSLLSHENNSDFLNKVTELILEIGKNRNAVNTARKSNNEIAIEEAHKNIDRLVEQLRDVVNIDYSDQGHINALISNNIDIRFKIDDTFYVYDYYKNNFYYERKEGNTVISKDIKSEEFKSKLGLLNRNVNYSKLGGKPYTDILGNKHDSYEEYLINTNSIVTDIAMLVDKNGRKISNFMPTTNNNRGGVPLIMNIDTGNIKVNTPTTPSLIKFRTEYALNEKYDFILGILDTFIKSGQIKFNGVTSVRKIDKTTGKPVLVYYTPSTKSLTVTQDWVNLHKKDPTGATLTFVHDVLHSLIGTRTNEEQAELTKNLVAFQTSLKETQEFKDLLAKENKTDIDDKIITIVNIKDVEEILTYGLTDLDFAKFLNEVKSTEDNVTSSFWSQLKEIIRQLARAFGINTKLDELNSIFDTFISGGKYEGIIEETNKLLGDVESGTDFTNDPFFNEFEEDINPVSYTSEVKEGYTRMYRAELPIGALEGTLPDWVTTHEEFQSLKKATGRWFYKTRQEAEEFGRDFGPAVGGPNLNITYVDIPTEDVEKYNAAINPEAHQFQGGPGITNEYFLPKEIADIRVKASSFTSTINQELTKSPFSLDQEDNIINVLSNIVINDVLPSFKGTKLNNISSGGVRTALINAFGTKVRGRIANKNMNQEQFDLLKQVALELKNNDDFWKLFRIRLSNEYGYNINDIEDFQDDVEYLEKSWDQTDTFTKDPLLTVDEEIKNLINKTFEIDPNSVNIVDGVVTYKLNTNTPTGFPNTLKYSERGNKLRDLMRGSLNKEDMLKALFDYATYKNSVFAKTLFSIHQELSSNPELLTTWFISFDKAIVDSYIDLTKTINSESGTQYELNLKNDNQNSVQYYIANEWTGIIVSRGESGYYTKDWIEEWNKLYLDTVAQSPNFTKMNEEIAANLVKLYKMVGIEVGLDNISYEFIEHRNNFVKNMIQPLLFIKGEPNVKHKENKVPYIERLVANSKSAFNEFGNLLRLADRVKYFREDHFSYSNTNTKGNLIHNVGNHNFITTLFKKLDNTDDVVYESMINYTLVPSNQHSFLLWGDELINNEVVVKGRGIFNYIIKNGLKTVVDGKDAINKVNLEKIKSFRYGGAKNLSDNIGSEYSDLTTHDWTLKKLIYYFGGGETTTTKEVNEKLTAIFPLLNPSDRKNTNFFEAPIINISKKDIAILLKEENRITNNVDAVRNIPIFKAIYNTVLDEMIAMQTAKQVIFKLDSNGRAIWNEEQGRYEINEDILSETINSQIYYHYKFDKDNKSFIKFFYDKVAGVYRLDTSASGNVFNINNINVIIDNKQKGFNDVYLNNVNFIRHLMNSSSLNTALNVPLVEGDINSTFKNRLEQFVYQFIIQHSYEATASLGTYKDIIEKTYIRKENLNREEKKFILQGKEFEHGIIEYALNTYLFNTEQLRLFYGSIADYKSYIDLNKRGGEVLANGISSVLRGTFKGATISDIKLKSNIYNHMITGVTKMLKLQDERIRVKRLNQVYTDSELASNTIEINGVEEKLFTPAERQIYDYVSPYLSNDSANGVSLITFDEFEKRINGYGLSSQYKAIIDKVRNGIELNREETHRFASMQKNFYYSLDYNSDLRKMIPNQVKNAEVVLTPELIKDLQLETLDKIMRDKGIGQVNLESAEKVGSLYIARIADDNGDILDEQTVINELTKASRTYNYENLRMQLEVPDAIYNEQITLGRQIYKKIIENLSNDHPYTVNGKTLNGSELKSYYFKLLNSNVWQDAMRVVLPFDIRVDKDGIISGDVSFDKIVELLEKEGINRNLTKNIIYSVQKGNNGLSNLPIFFNTHSNRWENILTSLFTNGVNTQKFPGLHAPQMSSIFMNKKKGTKQSDLTSITGINFHESIFSKLNKKGEIVKKSDIKLQSNILYEGEEGSIIKAQVLVPRWSRLFKDSNADINNLSEDVRTMIGYRVPTEGKFSMYVFEVVGFLPDTNGPAIVLPDDFITQTNADFDMDTVFALLYNIHSVNKTEEVDGEKIITKVIERLPFNEKNDNSGFNYRVEAIMHDRRQLIHVLSTTTGNKELINLIDSLDDEAFENIKDRVDYFNVRKKVGEIIVDWDIVDQNTRKARENEILDLYYSILTDPIHYIETIGSSNFKSITEAKKLTDELLNIGTNKINNLTFSGQQHYHNKSHQGRNLKGISLSLDRFNAIAQVAGIYLTESLKDRNGNISDVNTLPTIRYEVSKKDLDRVKKDYKGDIIDTVEKDGKYFVTIVHRYVGNNPAGTFRNINGQYINSYSSQTTANILDNVAFPLPNNVGDYTVSVWKMLVSLGSTYDISTLFVNQPIIRDLSDTFDRYVNTIGRGREIEETKRKFQTLLYQVIVKQGGKPVQKWEDNIADGNSIFVGGSDKAFAADYKYLGYENEMPIVLDGEGLSNNVNKVVLNKGVFTEINKTTDVNRLKEIENFLRYQLQIIETFKHYKTYSDAITDAGNILNTDAKGAGPTFETTNELIYNIDRSNKQGILEINGVSAMSQIFPKIFGLNKESAYPVLEQFFIMSNLLSVQMFNEHFIGQSNLYQHIKRTLNDYITDKKYDSRLAVKITKYLNNSLLKDLPWLSDIGVEEKRTILGIDTEKVLDFDFSEIDSIALFEQLSVANQIDLLKGVINYDQNHIIRNLKTHLQDKEIARNGYHLVEYANSDSHDKMTESFNDLWYSDNEFERIVARNLIKYEYITNGFGFGFSSFSKIIPSNIFHFGTDPFISGKNNERGIGVSQHLYGKLNQVNQLKFSADIATFENELNIASKLIFNSDYKERFLRANWTDNNIVPDAGGLTKYEPGLTDEDGNPVRLRYFQMGTNPENYGIISMSAKVFQTIPTSRISNNVKGKQLIKLSFTDRETGDLKWVLFQRIDAYVTISEFGKVEGTYFWYPVGKLESSENEETSIFKENNQLPDGSEIESRSEYLGLIEKLNEKIKVNELIYKEPLNLGNNIDKVISGNKTATTVDSKLAEKFATVKVGDYIKLTGTDKYIKVTKNFHHISLNTLPARLEWADKEARDIRESHPLENNTDLYQVEYEYIGTIEDVMEDANADYSDIGELVDENDSNNISKINVIPIREKFIRQSVEKDKDYIYLFTDNANRTSGSNLLPNDSWYRSKYTTTKDLYYPNQTQAVIRGLENAFPITTMVNEKLSQWTDNKFDEYKTIIDEEIENIKKSIPYYKGIKYPEGTLYGKGTISNMKKTAPKIWNYLTLKLREIGIDNSGFNAKPIDQLDLFDSKPVSYTSSTTPEVNNAINSALPFIERNIGNYANRINILKGVGSLKDTYNQLTDADLKKLLVDGDLAGLAKALTILLKQYQLDVFTPKDDKSKGGLLARLQEYENTSMDDIVSDPVIRRDFTNFMSRAISFLKGATAFETLSSVSGAEFTAEEKIVNDLIKELQNMIPTFKNMKVKVDKLWSEFNEMTLAEYTKNPDIVAGLKKIMEAGDDESYVQMQLDALADTNNSFVALMVKRYMINTINADLDSSNEIGELEALLRKTFPNKNITSLDEKDFYKYLEFKDGKPTGKLIQKYDWNKFTKAKKAYFDHIIKTYGKNSQSYYNAINGENGWYNKNEKSAVTEEEFNAIVRKKKEDLSTPEFNAWKYRNVREFNGKIRFLLGDSQLAVPSDEYINPEYNKIKSDPLFQKFVEIQSKYLDYFGRVTILNRGFIPTLSNNEKESLTIAEMVKRWVDVNKFKQESESFVGENDEMVYRLTVPMIEYFSLEDEIKFDIKKKDELETDYENRVLKQINETRSKKFKTLGEVRAENRRIRKLNDDYHAGKINYNLADVFTQFIKAANIYKAKSDMKHEYDLGLYQIRNMQFNKRTSKGELVRNKAKNKALGKAMTGTMSGEGTNLEQHFSEWLEAIFYGNFDIDEGAWTTISKMLLKFTSAKNMWFNLTAGISNVSMGKIQVRLEAFAGWYFKHTNLNKADKMYISAIPDMIRHLGSTKSGNLTSAIIKMLDLTQNTNERDYSTGMMKANLLSSSSMYFINDLGEHYMQNVSGIAMMDHHRIVNGKIMSLAEFQFDNYKEALNKILNDEEKADLDRYIKERYASEEFKESKKDYLRDYILKLPINKSNAFVEAKKAIDKDSLTEFEKYAKLIDAFYLDENGYAKMKDEIEIEGKKYTTKLDENELAAFISKAKYVVKKQQGYYNKEDAGMFQRRGLGKMLIQFRKYMRPGWNKRFGSKFGKSYWNESRDEYDKGSYVSLYQFLTSPFKHHKVMDNQEAKDYQNMMSRILKDFGHFVTNFGVYWNTLDDFEKGNVMRSVMDMVYLASVIMLGAMVKGLKPEDDDDKDFAYDLTAYEIDRLMSELMMYTPFGVINEGQKILKSPAAVQGTAIDSYKLLRDLVSYQFRTDEQRIYATGIYAKESKIKVDIMKLVPVVNKINQLQRIDKFNKYYILFRG